MTKARYPIITADIIDRIKRGEFADGFPTYREVVKHYRASSRTIDQVWEALKAQGYIETVLGQGTYLKKR